MQKNKIHTGDAKSQWLESAKERLFNFTVAGGQIRGAVVLGNRMIKEMQANHQLGVLETLVLGHSYLGAVLMTTNLKGYDRIGMKIDCSGPIKGINVEANAFGEVRGYLKQVPIPIDKPLEDFNLSPFFGAGFLNVTKILEDGKSPFTGQVMLKYGSIAKDLNNYFWTSEQIPTAFNLSVHFDREGMVTGAGGLFLQPMPEANKDIVEEMEKRVAEMPSIGIAFSEGAKADEFVSEHFGDRDLKILSDRKVAFMCHCNEEKIEKILTMLSPDEFEDIKENGPFPLEVACHFCGTKYEFSKEQIRNLGQKRKNRN